ncbi:Na+/H+ antiporter NhaA [Solirubrobacter sp. CPCC 204708]|uniref:Na(+)/H(+) antiporter NhaA n=1 Tax=Solirubrobacter deserti TaxID=2282478 RepID=A0ABT4RIE0_9ACTN|nr:Na+/H+ antiporter NhaA [Solirubrobacter deserti]MBE2320291.1 Na+/H+ antiporter NhaA [Solirubrobacter deserti]MDA0138322.1 Na+/H+ antiporter NhaA [Solirubrobacter deserti]
MTRSSTREFVGQFAAPLRSYLHTETGGAGLLLAATILALVWANSPLSGLYEDLWGMHISISFGDFFDYDHDLRHWVNDGLMVLFFFVIGLELRRQLSMGELTDRSRFTIPALGAIAGLIVPAVVYLVLNPSGEEARGWGIAMATDTAFVLGALAVVGPAFPAHLRVFMLSLSVVDDIGALLAIAVFYSDDVSLTPIVVAAACVAAMALVSRALVFRGPVYLVVGLVLWVAMVESGIHPTLAGVVLGLLVSAFAPRPEDVREAGALARAFGQSPLPALARSAKLSVERAVSPNERLTELLHPWSSFFVVPVFALANAGVAIDGELIERAVSSTVTWGVIAGLVFGKLAGIGAMSLAGVRFGLGHLPGRIRPGELLGGAALGGIGFTISLFVADLAFDSAALADEARVGILAASLLALGVAWAIFALDKRLAADEDDAPIMVLDRPVDPAVDHIRGPVDAPLELVEYGDFECPFCGRATGAVEELRERLGDRLRYVFRHLPLPDVHPHAELAAEAAEAAAEQGAFWELHDRLFAHQDQLSPTDLVDHAQVLGLDVERFARTLGSGEHAARVREDVASAEASGAEGTPTFFVNGRRLIGRYDADALEAALLGGGELPPLPATEPEIERVRMPDDGSGPSELVLDDFDEEPASDAFPRLSDGHIATLSAFGERRPITRGEPVFGDGTPTADFVVVLSGAVAMVVGYGERNLVGRVHGPRSFVGELALLRGELMLTTAVAARDGEVLVVPAERFADGLAADLELRDIISRAYLLRRSILLSMQAGGDPTRP